jgi:outer membrane protein W
MDWTRAGRLAGAAAALALTIWAPATAHAQVVAEGTRVGVQGGWRYAPNASFEKRVKASGHPLTSSPIGGPQVQGVFGYRLSDAVEVAIELGYSRETFEVVDGPLTMSQMPVLIALRWFPLQGRFGLEPYLGGGAGYFLNFFDGDENGSFEAHAQGGFVMAGATLALTQRISLIGELRYAYAESHLNDLGWLQVGGASGYLGVQIAFPPEPQGLQVE